MRIEDRLARLEADRTAEINDYLRSADLEGVSEFLELLPGAEILDAMSDAELHRIASGDCSSLTSEQRAELNGPVPPEALALMRSRKTRTLTPHPPAGRRRP